MSSLYSPVVLTVFNRPDKTVRCIEALLENAEASGTDLFVFSDGSKSILDHDHIAAVRKCLSKVKGFRSIHVIERDVNFGVARNVIDGLTYVLADYDSVIHLEDDIIVSPFFLKYMNDALNCYRAMPTISCVTGYVPNINIPEAYSNETFFLRGADIWGWGTWRRAWAGFNKNSNDLYSELVRCRSLRYRFNFNNSFNYMGMLKANIMGLNDSWAIRWYASCFLNEQFVLYPTRSLVQNIGADSSGAHFNYKTSVYDTRLCEGPVGVTPLNPEDNLVFVEAFAEFFKMSNLSNSSARISMSMRTPLWLHGFYRYILRGLEKFLNRSI